jgi:peptidyl-prolyl cis-trans isomerase D
MAIIGKIREKSTLVLIIIGGAIVAFVLTDLFSAAGTGQGQGPLFLAQVDEETISPEEYDEQLQTAYQNYEAQTQQPIDAQTKSRLKETVWNQMLAQIIIGEERDELGVKVTSKELFDMVQGDDPHPQVRQLFTDPESGMFNPGAVVQFLQNLDQQEPQTKEQWLNFERALKSNQETNKYNTLIKKGLYMPTALAKKQYSDNNTQLNFKFIYKLYNSIADSVVEISESDVKAYYEDHKNEYEQPASRRMFYAYMPVRPSDEDVAAAAEEAQEIYEKFKTASNDSIFVNANSDRPFDPMYYSADNIPLGIDSAFWSQDSGSVREPVKIEFTYLIHKIRDVKQAPDSVEASHILIGTQERSAEEAEAIADSLMNLLEGELATIPDLIDLSDDVTSAKNNGELGWFTEGTMVKPFNDAAFSMEVEEYRKVRTRFGYHIIKVTDRTEPRRKAQIATVEIFIDPSKETYANVFNQANSFSIDANDEESFNNLINEKDIQRRVIVLSENMTTIEGNEASRDLVRWARDAKAGDISEAYDIGDAFAVGFLESVNKEGPQPLANIRNRIEFLVRNDKKAEILKKEMSGASDINSLASQIGLSVNDASAVSLSNPALPSIGLEPKVVGKVASLEAGQTSVPIQGDNGVYVVKMEGKNVPGEPDVSLTRNTVQRDLATRIDNGAVFNALKEETEIEDNRAKFF